MKQYERIAVSCPLCYASGQEWTYWRREDWDAQQQDVMAFLTGEKQDRPHEIGNGGTYVVEGPFACGGCGGTGSVIGLSVI